MQFTAVIKDEGFKLTEAQAVRPISLFEETYAATHTARRDWASFSVVVLCSEDLLLSLTDAPAFTPRDGHRPVRAAVSCPGLGCADLAYVGMVDDDDGMHKADILLQNDYYTLPGRRAYQLRLALDVPADAKPGTYEGVLKFFTHELFGDEAELSALPFKVTVHDVLLPCVRESMFHLDLWQHLSNIARKHETPLFSDAHFRVVERYVESLAALGQKAVTVIASEIPWSGQFCFRDREYQSDLFEYNMIRVTKRTDGVFTYDYSAAERYVQLCFAHGIDREIEIFGLVNIWMDEGRGYGKASPGWPDGVRIRYYDEASGTLRYMRESEEIAAYIAALQDFLDHKGWLGISLVVADEPHDMGKFRASLNAVRAAAPKLRFKTAINHAEFISEFKDVVADYVPMLPAATTQWDALQDARKAITGRLLYYVCCFPPHPNNFIRSPLAEGRLIPLLAGYLGMDGFLRWNYTVWPERPRERLRFRTGEWWSGDTCFVYPSHGGEPLLSLRYYALKRGIGDFELVRRVKALPGGEAVLEKAWSLLIRQRDIRLWEYEDGADTSGLYSSCWQDYERAKALLLEALEQA